MEKSSLTNIYVTRLDGIILPPGGKGLVGLVFESKNGRPESECVIVRVPVEHVRSLWRQLNNVIEN